MASGLRKEAFLPRFVSWPEKDAEGRQKMQLSDELCLGAPQRQDVIALERYVSGST